MYLVLNWTLCLVLIFGIYREMGHYFRGCTKRQEKVSDFKLDKWLRKQKLTKLKDSVEFLVAENKTKHVPSIQDHFGHQYDPLGVHEIGIRNVDSVTKILFF